MVIWFYMLTIGEHILLALAEIWDLLDSVPSRRQTMAALANPGNFEPFYKKSSLTSSLRRMLKTGEIERIEKDGEIYYRLTTQGRGRISRNFPLFRFGGEKWDGRWRLAIFDISEEEKGIRDQVRHKLEELHFGMLQKSVWLSPLKLEEDLTHFLETKRLSSDVLVMVVDELWVDDERELASKVWKLNQLEDLYDSLIIRWEKTEEGFKKDKDKERRKRAAFGWEHKFLSLLRSDPCLPPELLPDDWPGAEARDIYKKRVRKILC